MEYTCFNCEELLEIPELVTKEEEGNICSCCNTYLHLEVYHQCIACKTFILKA